MGWSIRIARIAGSEVRVHVTFLIFLAWIAFAGYHAMGPEAAVRRVVFVLLLFTCVLLHEFGHALAARRYGIPTPDITLLPIGGVARLKRMPDEPMQEVVVALAGPAVNVLIAAVLILGFGASLAPPADTMLTSQNFRLLDQLALVNVALVLFNLIPAFPMDGGRVLRAMLAMRMRYGKATQIAANVGQAFAFLFAFVGLFYNPFLIFIALFLYLGASQEAQAAGMKDLAGAVTVNDAMITEITTLDLSATISDAVDALLRTSQHEFPVLDAGGRVHGILTRDEMIRALKEHGPMAPVTEAMKRDIPQVHYGTRLDLAFQQMQECQCPALPVVDRFGRLMGIITPENVGELMMVRAVLPPGQSLPWRRPIL